MSAESKPGVLQRDYSVPIHVTDMSIFDGAFTYMKQRFAEEMRRMEEEMNTFSKNLMSLYGQTTTVQTSLTPDTVWDKITSSPLIEGEGEDKMLKLQFDVSQYEPNEVTVKIFNDMLIVSAKHQEKTDSSAIYSEYNREFLLPVGTDPETVESALSKEGILTVRAPLHLAIEDRDKPSIK